MYMYVCMQMKIYMCYMCIQVYFVAYIHILKMKKPSCRVSLSGCRLHAGGKDPGSPMWNTARDMCGLVFSMHPA